MAAIFKMQKFRSYGITDQSCEDSTFQDAAHNFYTVCILSQMQKKKRLHTFTNGNQPWLTIFYQWQTCWNNYNRNKSQRKLSFLSICEAKYNIIFKIICIQSEVRVKINFPHKLEVNFQTIFIPIRSLFVQFSDEFKTFYLFFSSLYNWHLYPFELAATCVAESLNLI